MHELSLGKSHILALALGGPFLPMSLMFPYWIVLIFSHLEEDEFHLSTLLIHSLLFMPKQLINLTTATYKHKEF